MLLLFESQYKKGILKELEILFGTLKWKGLELGERMAQSWECEEMMHQEGENSKLLSQELMVSRKVSM